MTHDEADSQLRTAIIAHAAAYGIADPAEELLSDYAVVAAWIPNQVTDDPRTTYTAQFTTPNVPRHVAVGLLTVGLDRLCEDDE